MGERDRGCEGEGLRNEKLITSSIKIAMIHHDVWTGCSSRLIKGRTGKLSGETKFNYLRNHIYHIARVNNLVLSCVILAI
jgi:hypothetical protein